MSTILLLLDNMSILFVYLKEQGAIVINLDVDKGSRVLRGTFS